MRQASVLVIGQTGSGKTILLNVLTAGAGRCRDALVWHIDLNGGSLSQMWLAPWLEGHTDRPAIDWAASTPAEALDMALAALRIAKDRKTSARKLKIAADTTLMPVSPDLPEIVIFLDEGAEAVSPGDRSVVAPMTGSSLPSRAAVVRLRPNWSSTSELDGAASPGPPAAAGSPLPW